MKSRSFSWWGCAALVTSSWIFLASFYHPSLLGPGIACVLGAVFFAFVAIGRNDASFRIPWLVTGALAVATAAVFPFSTWGARMSLIVLSLGLLGAHLPARGLKRLSVATALVGLVSTLQAGVVGLYTIFLSDRHFALPLSFFDYWIPRLFGTHTSVIGQEVFFSSGTALTAVTPSWDQLALLYGLLACLASVVFATLGSVAERRWGILIRAVLVTGAYLVIRRLLLVLLVLEGAPLTRFWNPTVTFLSLLPLFLVLWVLVEIRPGLFFIRVRRLFEAASSLRSGVILLPAFIGTVAAASYLYLAIPGAENGDVVLFDEAHGGWESTLKAMDKEWYGKQSTYNFYSLYDWLSYYYDVGRIEEPIAEATLSGCDILIVKIPSKPFAQAEIAAIAQFVHRGGGLFVIGDHTNVFGSTSSLNPLLRAFGLALNDDATYDLATGYFTRFTPPRNTLSPIMQHVDHFQFLTSCSIRAPWWAWRTIFDTAVLATHADYSTKDFFAEERYALTSAYGAFTQTVALPHGLGRVVVFTDSTCFSNFSLHMDGYPDFLLGSLGFLGRQNPRFPLRTLFGAISLCCLVLVAVWLAKKRPARYVFYVVAGAVLGWAVFSVLCVNAHRTMYPLPQSDRDIPYVYFDAPHSAGIISPTPSRSTTTRYRFDTFFVWTQRVNQVPVLLDSFKAASLDLGRPYIIINPRRDLDDSFLEFLETYVKEKAGKLVLMDTKTRDQEGLRKILERFSLQTKEDNNSRLVLTGADVEKPVLDPSSPVSISVARSGEGVVLLATDSVFFSDAQLGGSFTVPSPKQRELYDLEYFMFEELLYQPVTSQDDSSFPQAEEDE